MNLNTQYLGLDLPHPFIVGASPIGARLDRAKAAEDAGAAALVLHSLFEEQFIHEDSGLEAHVLRHSESSAEAPSYFTHDVEYTLGPDNYLEHLGTLKQALGIPVIASLNGTHAGGWTDFAQRLEQAGADALEINLYYQPRGTEENGADVEEGLLDVIRRVRDVTKIPLAAKLSPYFSSLPNFALRAHQAGASALVLFNRFYQPDIDIEQLETIPTLRLSDSSELLSRLRWLAMLHGRCGVELAVTGGVHTVPDAVKAIMAGADAIQLVSSLLQKGTGHLQTLIHGLDSWLEEMEYESLEQMKGSMSYLYAPDPDAIERANYLRVLQSWRD